MTDPRTWWPQRLDDPRLPELPGNGAVTVALVAGHTGPDGWAPQAAVAMARGWALSGIPTYLCDLALEEPVLHDVLQVDNGEGVSDLILYGASPRRVARPVEPGLFLASAGTVTAEPGALRASPRWDALVDAFQEAGGLLLLYVPAGVPGADAVLARADGVVVLRPRDEAVSLGEADARVLGAFGPVDQYDAPAGAAGEQDEEAPEVPAPDGRGEAALPLTGRRRESTRRKGCLRWILMILLLAAMVVVLVAAMGWIRIPGLGPQAASATLVPAPGEPPASGLAIQEAPTALTSGPLQAWALALEAHRDPAAAATRVEELRARWPDLLFWVAPVRVRDERYHRVLAGPATTRDEVETVRSRLGGDASWIPREARWAFRLGELPDLEAARTWGSVLADLGVPTHVLVVAGPDGADAYHLYAGGYASEAEAAELAEILRSQDLGTAPLTERRGRVPA